MIPFSAELEQNLMKMSPAEANEFLTANKTRTQIAKIVTTGYHAINLIHYFTAGADEVKCWTITKGTKAPQAAGRIHSDMEKGFICAEIMHWTDFENFLDEAKCRDAGKLHQQGKTYEVEDGDVVYFKFNASKGKK